MRDLSIPNKTSKPWFRFFSSGSREAGRSLDSEKIQVSYLKGKLEKENYFLRFNLVFSLSISISSIRMTCMQTGNRAGSF